MCILKDTKADYKTVPIGGFPFVWGGISKLKSKTWAQAETFCITEKTIWKSLENPGKGEKKSSKTVTVMEICEKKIWVGTLDTGK